MLDVRPLESMKIIKTSLISLLLIFSTSCAWVARDYYFESSVKNNEWSEEIREGAWSDKSLHPATVIFSYTDSLMTFNFNISHQNPTCWSPLLIPVIPAPGQLGSLYADITIDAKDTISFNINSWVITDVSTGNKYSPNWVNSTMPKVLKKESGLHL